MQRLYMSGKPVRVAICALAFVLQFSLCPTAHAQVAGLYTLPLLDMPSSARAAGLGFDFLAVYDADITLTLNNPSLINGNISNHAAIGFINMFAGANFGSVAYSYDFDRLGAFTFGLQFGSYGLFEGYDEYDQTTWDFRAADYIFSIGWGRALNENLTIGANFKPILSQYESYTALAFAIDLAGSFMNDDRSLVATLMARNIGAQIFTFDGTTERLPFELSAAASYKLSDAPFRLMLGLNELQTWNLRYEDPLNPTYTTDPFTGETTGPSEFLQVLDNIGRHVQLGVEVDIKSMFFARLGYSYRQMVEMRAAETFNTSGFSFGVGVRVQGFELCYSRNNYHLMQAPNFISITTDIDRFFR